MPTDLHVTKDTWRRRDMGALCENTSTYSFALTHQRPIDETPRTGKCPLVGTIQDELE